MSCEHSWKWVLDDKMKSWIRCEKCHESMFADDIGVILINWKFTDWEYTIKDVLLGNISNRGIIVDSEKTLNKIIDRAIQEINGLI